MAFPNFYGKRCESASNFLDDLEMAFLVSGRDEEEIKLRAFPLVLREEAKVWFQGLEPRKKDDWGTLREAFMGRFGEGCSPEEIWRKLSSLQQTSPLSYLEYEAQFLKLWTEWENTLEHGEKAPNFLQKERFLDGLSSPLKEKVKGKFPRTFEEAMKLAQLKDRKLQFQAYLFRTDQPKPQVQNVANEAPPPIPVVLEDPHLELLQRVTNQLDNLSINMVQGVQRQQRQPPNGERNQNDQHQQRQRRQRRDYFCYNCGEDGHGMYYCPYPRNYNNNFRPGGRRNQVSPPKDRPLQPVQPPILQEPPVTQILQRPIALQPVTEIPALPNNNVERAVNIISVEDKGKAKVREPVVMPIKKARVSEDASQRRESMETDNEAGTSKKEKWDSSCRRTGSRVDGGAGISPIGEDSRGLGIDGVLRRCVSISAGMQIIMEAHIGSSGGHFSTDITYKKILQVGLWWQSVMADVKSYCKTCEICQRMGRPTAVDMTPLTTIQPLEVFMKWGLDYMGPFKKVTPKKNKYIIMATCYVSKWVEAKALPNNTAKSTAWFLYEHIICKYGCPIKIVSDQGTHFINDTIEILIELLSIKHRKSTPYYPRCNGQAENSNKSIKTILTNNWDEKLQTTLCAYRTAYKVTTRMTPFRMVYGTEEVVPLEFVVPNLRMSEQYNMDFNTALKARVKELQRLDEIRQRALLEQ
ncbi:hypothetical protein L7F22_058658 [Adiantum nelumboides]|nr:hypothetical protein [Adiantum nelumboides]